MKGSFAFHILYLDCIYLYQVVEKMKFEIKVLILSLVFSLVCMLLFTYVGTFTQKTIYAYQVGIYKEESNKDNKLAELKEEGIEGMYYLKDNQYYVISMMSDSEKEIMEHASQVKGIMKTYVVSSDMTYQALLDDLSRGKVYD